MHTRRKNMIAMIKIAQKQLSLDDETYRSLLMRVTSCRSCTEMSTGQLTAVIKELKRLGFDPRTTNKHHRPPVRTNARNMLNKIEALLADNQLPWSYADTIAKRVFNCDKVQWLNNMHMHKLIGILQIYADRQEKNKHADA